MPGKAAKNVKAEEALRKSEEKFAKLFHSNPVALSITTEAEGRFIDVNSAFEKLSGFSREMVIGKTSVELGLIGPGDRTRFMGRLDAEGEIRDTEISMGAQSGKSLLLKGSIQRVAVGADPCILFTVEEITNISRVRDALRASEELFSKIFHLSPELGIITRASDGMVIAVNDSFLDATGFSREELLGKSTVEIKIWETPNDRQTLLENLRRTGVARDCETLLNRKSGERFPVLYSTISVDYRGESCLFAFGRDITEFKKVHEERERLETLLRQRQKTEALGTLAGGIAHDFNNILTSIIGYTELAKTKLTAPDILDGYLDQIFKSSLRARDLIQHILTFSRMRSVRKKRSVKISALVKETMEFLRASIPASIEIRQQISDVADTVLADPAQINQVVVNMVNNAAQAMEENGGVLEVNLAGIEFGPGSPLPHPDLEQGRYVLLSISDTGHGIGPEAIDRIFDPYFTTRALGRGTGLGLAIAHGIVKRHEGAITVLSKPGGGATFMVYLRVAGDAEMEESITADEIPHGTEKILIIDDEESIVNFLGPMLNDLGYAVTATTSPAVALALFKDDPLGFDLVITDYTMPGLNGDDLAKLMREARQDVPIIITTGFSERMSERKAEDLRLNAFVNKPVQRAEIARIVRKVLDGHCFFANR